MQTTQCPKKQGATAATERRDRDALSLTTVSCGDTSKLQRYSYIAKLHCFFPKEIKTEFCDIQASTVSQQSLRLA